MAELKLTVDQIKEKLDKDADFGIQFIVENQPNIVVDRLKQNGIDTVDTPEKAYNYLVGLLKVEPKKVGEILNNIPYDAANLNWTGSMDEFFPTVQTKAGGFWSGLLSGIGALATAVGGALGSTTGTGTTLTPAELEMLRKEEEAKAEALRVEKQRRALSIGVSLLILIILFAAIYGMAKASKAKKETGK